MMCVPDVIPDVVDHTHVGEFNFHTLKGNIVFHDLGPQSRPYTVFRIFVLY